MCQSSPMAKFLYTSSTHKDFCRVNVHTRTVLDMVHGRMTRPPGPSQPCKPSSDHASCKKSTISYKERYTGRCHAMDLVYTMHNASELLHSGWIFNQIGSFCSMQAAHVTPSEVSSCMSLAIRSIPAPKIKGLPQEGSSLEKV